MKSQVRRLTDKELEDYPIRNRLEGRFFRIQEISHGDFHVEGIDYWGSKVSRRGLIDVEDIEEINELINACVSDGREIQSKLNRE